MSEYLDDVLPALACFPIQKMAFHTWNFRLDWQYIDDFTKTPAKEILLYGTYFDLEISKHLQRVQFEELDAESQESVSSGPDSIGEKLKQWEESFDYNPARLQENFEEEQVMMRATGGNPEDVKLPQWERPILKPIRLIKTWL